MNLFIDSISDPCYIALFDENKNISSTISVSLKGNESSKTIPLLDEFLSNNNLSYNQLQNIVVVNGPGSFTGVRTVVLIANTLNFMIQKNMTSISYFDLFDKYPIIKSSSRRDSFIKTAADSGIEIIDNKDLSQYFEDNNISKLYGESNYNFEAIEIFENIDYSAIIQSIKFQNKEKIEPLYIKKPNIT